MGVASACSDAIAFSARYSWRNPIQAFSTTTKKMKIASVTSPSDADKIPAATSNTTIGDVTWSSRIRPADGCAPGSSSLGPSRARRAAASSVVRPRARSVPSVGGHSRGVNRVDHHPARRTRRAEASTRRDAWHQMAWRFWASKKCGLSAAGWQLDAETRGRLDRAETPLRTSCCRSRTNGRRADIFELRKEPAAAWRPRASLRVQLELEDRRE